MIGFIFGTVRLYITLNERANHLFHENENKLTEHMTINSLLLLPHILGKFQAVDINGSRGESGRFIELLWMY